MESYDNFEALNNEYLRLKMAVDKYKTDLEKSNKDLESALENKKNAENALKGATKPAEKRQYQEELNKAITAIKDLEIEIDMIEGKITNSREDIDKMIEAVRSIPEISEQCNQALEKNTERKIAKFQKQKKEQEQKKTTLVELKNIIQKHPQAQIFVNNIETKSLEISKRELEIKNIQEKIDKLDPKDPNYASDKAELEGDKTKLEGECTKLKGDRQTERDGLKKLLNNPKYNEHIDKLTTRSELDKDINNCERLIRRSDNKIKDYRVSNISVNVENSINSQQQNPPSTLTTPTKWETFKEDIKSVFSKKQPGDPSRLSKIGNTFKNLFKKQEALPAPTAPTATENLFKDEIKVDNAMQYQIVRDIFEEDKSKVADGVKKSSEAREAAKKDDGSR